MKSIRGERTAIALLAAMAPVGASAQPIVDALREVWETQAGFFLGYDIYAVRLESGTLGIGDFLSAALRGAAAPLQTGAENTVAGPVCTLLDCIVYEIEPVTLPDGSSLPWPRQMSPNEVMVRTGINPGSEVLGQISAAYGEAQMGLFGFGAPLPVPVYLNPTRILGAWSIAVGNAAAATAEAEAEQRNSASIAQGEADQAAAAMLQLEPAGTEVIDGITTDVFATDGLAMPPQEVDGQTFDINSAWLWIDPENDVIVKHRFEGTASGNGESREIFIETVNSDFRTPPGCGSMYMPFSRTMRMGGILDAAQAAELEAAAAQLAEFEQQLAEMPPEQRRMAERMLGPQMQMMRTLGATGAIENIERVDEVICNPDLQSLFAMSGPGEVGEPDDNLVQQIQLYLVELGYEPGNTDGVLDTLTQIAISQFQAEQGLQVTGEPSPQLAGILASLVDG